MPTFQQLQVTHARASKDIKEVRDKVATKLLRLRTRWEKKFAVPGSCIIVGGVEWYEILPVGKTPELFGIFDSNLKGRSYYSDLKGNSIYRKWSYEGHPQSGDNWRSGGCLCWTIESAIENYQQYPSKDDLYPDKYDIDRALNI